MEQQTRIEIKRLIKLLNITKTDDEKIERIANDFPGHYSNEQEYIEFQEKIADIVSYFNAEVEIISLSVYEKDNGFEIEATENGETYKVYAQLPDCPDSEHSFLDDNNDERILNKIISKVSDENGNLDLSAWCKLGAVCDYSHEEHNDYYVVVDDSDNDNYFFAKESPYSDYYNTFMLTELNENDNYDEELMLKLNELLKELQNDD